ncbi:hypothetical protein [Sphingobium vermicomposti]|uniref:HEPN domain-containing protein n=1 Tax=Sphingobium vermicomposti TaxID=529005 RepID=A0A846MC45_9SPHN|nr:hypothetical protein [Sphingobium vermicomposti]NIJ15355.1 hypothetical protein [Sphingobium vermicomposti]
MFMPDHPTARALLAFRAAHGRRWKAKLLFLWSNGRDVEEADGACLRQLRNQAGPAWLGRLSPGRWRAIERLAEPGDRQTASIFLDRAREFHEGARFGATVALAPALHLLAISCELGLKAYLLSRGWSHEKVARDFRHDLLAAFDEARRLGLPSPGRVLADLLAILGPAYAAHRIDALVADGYVCDFAVVLRAMGSLLDAVTAGLDLQMPTP